MDLLNNKNLILSDSIVIDTENQNPEFKLEEFLVDLGYILALEKFLEIKINKVKIANLNDKVGLLLEEVEGELDKELIEGIFEKDDFMFLESGKLLIFS